MVDDDEGDNYDKVDDDSNGFEIMPIMMRVYMKYEISSLHYFRVTYGLYTMLSANPFVFRWLWEYLLHVTIKCETWLFSHGFRLGHETIVCTDRYVL